MVQRHLRLEDRVKIETWIHEGYSLATIATRLGFSRAAITKEIQRSTRHRTMGFKRPSRITKTMYQAIEAQSLANQKKRSKIVYDPKSLTDKTKKEIKQRILEYKWSPEQILAKSKTIRVSVRTIYNWINKNQIQGLSNSDLRMKGKLYKRALSRKIIISLHQSKSDKKYTIQKTILKTVHKVLLNAKNLVTGNLTAWNQCNLKVWC
ncbi:helix-turn-helix domain-containing protein [Leuconostoc fallax]|nr:helix-turn-helix domain-containing protein [Leuconostoc fallax]MCO6183673.1 helix-turn-helix domain-containing protein [Leuconostoc fallax]